MKYTEGMIQSIIWRHHNFKPLFCNVFTGCNEWDALYISAAGYAIGYEIKLSRSDLKADFKKDRHNLLLERKTKSTKKYGKYGTSLGTLIKHFYYVCSGFEITLTDIPEYAGLMIINKYGCIKIIKNAPVLWKEKVEQKTIQNLYQTLGKRYIYKTMEYHRSEYHSAADKEAKQLKDWLQQIHS